MEIENLRKGIDEIDGEIAKLFVKRMEIVDEVAKYKSEHNIGAENTLREKEIILRVTDKMPEDIKLYGKELYTTLMDTSKAYQWRRIGVTSPVRMAVEEQILNGIKSFPTSASVAVQGIAGAYSSIACDKLFKLPKTVYFKDFDAVFSAVEKGFCEFGILPIENSSVGSVTKVYDLMREHKFYIVRAVKLHVKHCLLAPKGVDIKNVKEVFSHEQAIGQCEKFLKTLGDVKLTVCSNTAVAAKMLSETSRKDVACISSRECAGIYDLDILSDNIQDNDQNFTRFIVISKNLRIFEDNNKISIMCNLPHEAGSLNKTLNKFSSLGLNLTKLESRPILNSSFEFSFYFDVEAKIEKKEVLNLIGELDSSNKEFIFLGSYKEI